MNSKNHQKLKCSMFDTDSEGEAEKATNDTNIVHTPVVPLPTFSPVSDTIVTKSPTENDLLVDDVTKPKRFFSNIMTKYEYARVIGIRAEQIALGSPANFPTEDESDPLQLATRELLLGKNPLSIRRYYANGDYEDWEVSELIICKR